MTAAEAVLLLKSASTVAPTAARMIAVNAVLPLKSVPTVMPIEAVHPTAIPLAESIAVCPQLMIASNAIVMIHSMVVIGTIAIAAAGISIVMIIDTKIAGIRRDIAMIVSSVLLPVIVVNHHRRGIDVTRYSVFGI